MLLLYSRFSARCQGFPPVRVQDNEEVFTSLGNGHFFQVRFNHENELSQARGMNFVVRCVPVEALNLFQTEWKAINDDTRYCVGSDKLLNEALNEGPGWVKLLCRCLQQELLSMDNFPWEVL